MRTIEKLKDAVLFRSSQNAHRYFYFLHGKLHTFMTHEKDVLLNLAAMFGNLNACFANLHSTFTKTALGRRSVVLAMLASLLMPTLAHALPQGGESVSGNVSFSQPNDSTLNIRSSAQRSIANYQSFNIGRGETVNITLPNASSAILNRVIGRNPSEIFGALNSNGQVFLVNPSGILFGASAQVNVGSLFASTLDISNQDFLAGKMVFSRDPSYGPASVTNQGLINIQKDGAAVLMGSAVQNSGTIDAPKGQIHLAVGDEITMTMTDGIVADVTVDQALQEKVEGVQSAIQNTGNLRADGGLIRLQTDLASNIYERLINNEGVIEARGIVEQNGKVELIGNSDDAKGLVLNSGQILATNAFGQGGEILVLGNNVAVTGNALIDASGETGGGSVLIGGDYRGQNAAILNAEKTLIGQNTQIKADALTQGDGGKVVVWADDVNLYQGNIRAQGGVNGGNGGFVEVSGKNTLVFDGQVDAGATQGNAGTVLLDPKTITIQQNNPDINDDGTTGDNITSLTDLDNATADYAGTDSIITAGAVNSLLTGNNHLVLAATNAITVNKAIAGTGDASLTLDAATITLFDNVSLAGTGTLFLNASNNISQANSGGTGIGAITADTLDIHIGSGTASLTNLGNNVTNLKATGANGLVQFTDADSVNLAAADMSGGTLQVTASGKTTSTTGNITQTSAITAQTLILKVDAGTTTLNDSNNDVTNLRATATTGTVDYTDANSVNLQASNLGTGTLKVTASGDSGSMAGDITQSGTLTAGTLDINLDAGAATLTNTANNVTNMKASAAGGSVDFTDADTVNLQASNLGTGTLKVTASGNAGSTAGNITQSGAITASTLDVNLDAGTATLTNTANDITHLKASAAGGTVSFTDANSVNLQTANVGAGTLKVTASGDAGSTGGDITQSGAITAGTLDVTVDAGTATLTHAANDVTSLKATAAGGTVDFTDANSVAIQASNLGTGTLKVTASGDSGTAAGDITQSGAIIAGTLDVNVESGTATLTTTTNDVTNLKATSTGGTVSFTDANSVNLQASNVGAGTLKVTASGAAATTGDITQSGEIIAGTLDVKVDAGTATLTNAGNDVTDLKATATTGAVDFTDANSVNLQASNLGTGTLKVTASGDSGSTAGDITQSGAITAGTLDVNLDAGIATLTTTTNNVTNLKATATGGTVNFIDTNSVNMLASDLGSGTLKVTASGAASTAGDITQSGAITAGTLEVKVDAGTATLNNTANDVNDLKATATTGTVNFTDANSVNLLVSNTGTGTLKVTASGDSGSAAGDITQSGAITAGTLDVIVETGTATLNDVTNAVTNLKATAAGGTVDFADTDTVNMLASNLGSGTLKVTASGNAGSTAGNITQSGAVIAGTMDVNLDAGTATLTNTANDVTHLKATAAGGTVNFTDANSVNIQTSDVSAGTLKVTASGDAGTTAGDITQSGVITAGTLDVTVGTGTATLSDAANDVTNLKATAAGGTVDFIDTNSVNLQASNLGAGTLRVTVSGDSGTTAGDITQSGAVIAGTLDVNLEAGTATLTTTTNDVTHLKATAANGTVNFTDANSVNLQTANVGTGTLKVTASGAASTAGDITQSGAITAGTLDVKVDAGTATLTNVANDVTHLKSTATTGTINFTDANSVNLQASNLGTGTLKVTTSGDAGSTSGDITQTGNLIAGTVDVTIDSGTATLTDVTNNATNFKASATGGTVNYTDADTVNMLASNLGTGTLKVTASGNPGSTSGNITQSGAISADTLEVTVDAGTATLTNTANDINKLKATATTGTVNFTDTNSVTIQASNVGTGTLKVTASGDSGTTAGDILQSGAITAGTLDVAVDDGTATLTNTANDVTNLKATAVSGTVNFTDANSVAIQASNLGTGTLKVTASGDSGSTAGNITQTGAIAAGTLDVNLDAGTATLTTTINDVTHLKATAAGGTVNFTDANSVNLQASNVGAGTLKVTASGAAATTGDITQSGGITAETLDVKVDAGTATLNNAANDVTDLKATATTGTVDFTDANSVNLQASNLGTGTLKVNASGDAGATAGDITQSGAITAGTLEIALDAGNATLTTATNNVANLKANATGGSVQYTDANALNVLASTITGGQFKVKTPGDITAKGDLQAGTLLSLESTGGTINMDEASGSALTHTAQNIDLKANNGTGKKVIVNQAGTLVHATGNGSGGGDQNFDPLTRPVNPGDTIDNSVSGTVGTVTITGVLQNAGTIQADGLSSGDININYGGTPLDLTNVSITATATATPGVITVNGTAPASGTGTNGTLVRTGTSGGADVNVTADSVSGTGASVVADALNFDVTNALTLSGNFNNVPISILNSGSTHLTDTTSALNIQSLLSNTTASLFAKSIALNGPAIAQTLDLDTSSIGGGNGNITQTGVITADTLNVQVGSGTATLNNTDNDVTDFSATATSGGTVAYTDKDSVNLLASNLGSGTLKVTASGDTGSTSGDITQSGPVSADTLELSLQSGSATLDNTANDVTNFKATTSGGNISITDANSLNLETTNVGTGTLSVTASGDTGSTAGDITQSGDITAGTLVLTIDDGAVTWIRPGNDVTNLKANASGGTVQYTDANDVNLHDSNLGTGTLQVTAGGPDGDIDLQGNVQGGSVSLTAGGASGDITQSSGTGFTADIITLNAQGDIHGTGTSDALDLNATHLTVTQAHDALIQDSDGINIAGANGNNLIITAANGDITTSAAVTATQTVFLSTTGGTGNITVNTAGPVSGSTVNLTTGAGVTSGNIAGDGEVQGNTVNLLSNQGNIGTSETTRFNTRATDDLNAQAPSGHVWINQHGGGVELTGTNTAQGDFILTTVDPGDITVTGTVSANDVRLNTTGSTIFVNNDILGSTNVFLSAAHNGDIIGPGLISGTNVHLYALNGEINSNTNATNLFANTPGNVTINEANSVILGASSSGGTFSLTTGNSFLGLFDPGSDGSIQAAGDVSGATVNLTSNGGINGTGLLSGTNVNLNATSNIDAHTNATNLTANTAGNVTIDETNSVILGASSAGGTFSLTTGTGAPGVFDPNGNGTINTTAAVTGDTVTLDASGNISGPGQISGTNVNLISDGDIDAHTNATHLTANASGNVSIDEANSVNVSNSGAGGTFTLTTGNASPGVFDPNGNGTIQATGAVTGDTVTLDAFGDIIGPGQISGNNVNLTADGDIDAHTNASNLTANAPGNVTIDEENSVNLGNSSAGGTFALTTGTGSPGVFDPNGNGTINVTGTVTGTTVTLNSAGSLIGPGQISGLNINLIAANDIDAHTNATNLTANAPGNVTIDEENSVNLGNSSAGGTFSITTGTGSPGVFDPNGNGTLNTTGTVTGSTVNMVAAGDLIGPGQISGDNVNLNAGGDIDAHTNASNLTANAPGNVTIDEENSVNLGNSSAGGTFALTTGTGSPGVYDPNGNGTINTTGTVTGSTVTLNSAGNLVGPGQISGDNVNLIAANDIDAHTNATNLTANAPGNVTIDEENSVNLGNSSAGGTFSITTGTGSPGVFDPNGNGTLNTTGTVTGSTVNMVAAGDLTGPGQISGDNINLNAGGNIDAHTNASNLTANAPGNVTIDEENSVNLGNSSAGGTFSITTGTGSPGVFDPNGNGTINTTGTVTGSTVNMVAAGDLIGPGQISGDNVNLNAGGDIDTHTNASNLTANAPGNVTIDEENSVNLGNSSAGGNFSITTGTGSPGIFDPNGGGTLNTTGTVTGTNVNLNSGGNITSTPGTGPSVVSTGNTQLTSQGTIGNSGNPFNVNVGGTLSVGASGNTGNTSANLSGNAGHGPVLLNHPPGHIVFNGVVTNPEFASTNGQENALQRAPFDPQPPLYVQFMNLTNPGYSNNLLISSSVIRPEILRPIEAIIINKIVLPQPFDLRMIEEAPEEGNNPNHAFDLRLLNTPDTEELNPPEPMDPSTPNPNPAEKNDLHTLGMVQP